MNDPAETQATPSADDKAPAEVVEALRAPPSPPSFVVREVNYVRIHGPVIQKMTHRELVSGKYPPSFFPFLGEAFLEPIKGAQQIPYSFGLRGPSVEEAFEQFGPEAKRVGDDMMERIRSKITRDELTGKGGKGAIQAIRGSGGGLMRPRGG